MISWLKNVWEWLKQTFSRDVALQQSHDMLMAQVREMQETLRSSQEDARIAQDNARELTDRFDAEQRRHGDEVVRLDTRLKKIEEDRNKLWDDLSESKRLTRQALEETEECRKDRDKLTETCENLERLEKECQEDRRRQNHRIGVIEAFMKVCTCGALYDQEHEGKGQDGSQP